MFKDTQELDDALVGMGYEGTPYFRNPDFLEDILGVTDDGRVVYHFGKMVESLMKSDDMSHEDAVEFIEYNTIRTIPYMGDRSPVIVYDFID